MPKLLKNTVDLKNKLKAVKKFENGENVMDIAKEYNVSFGMIYYWQKNKEKIKKEILESKMNKNDEINVSDKFSKKNKSDKVDENDNMREKDQVMKTKGSFLNPPVNGSDKTNKKLHNNSEITLKDKLKAVRKFENGENVMDIAKKYNVSFGMIYYWAKNKKKIKKEILESKMNKNNEINENDKFSKKNKSDKFVKYGEIKEKTPVMESNSPILDPPANFNDKTHEQMHCISLITKLKAVKMFESGTSLEFIAKRFNTTIKTVKQWVEDKSIQECTNTLTKNNPPLSNSQMSNCKSVKRPNDANEGRKNGKRIKISYQYENQSEETIKTIFPKINHLDNEEYFEEYNNIKRIYMTYTKMSETYLKIYSNLCDKKSSEAIEVLDKMEDHSIFLSSDYFREIKSRYNTLYSMLSNTN